MTKITVPLLNELYERVKIWTLRTDVPLARYEDFYKSYLIVDKFIFENPSYFSTPEEYDEAYWVSSFIHIRVLETINITLAYEELAGHWHH